MHASRHRLIVTLLALCAALAHLGWEHLNGGVASHHLLANPDLPAVSNWWGALVIPLLAWWTVRSSQRRLALAADGPTHRGPSPLLGFLCALAYGGALAALFAAGSALVDFLFFGLLALGLVVRLWRPEYLLGFVCGMTFVVGAVLPAIFGAVIALFSWLVHTVASAVWRRIRPPGGLA